MNKTWLALSSVALLAWYAIIVPGPPRQPIALHVTVLARADTVATAVVVAHIANERLQGPIVIAGCDQAPMLHLERRQTGRWVTVMTTKTCSRDVSAIFLDRGHSLASRLTIVDPGLYRVTAREALLSRGRRIAGAPIRSKPFSVTRPRA